MSKLSENVIQKSTVNVYYPGSNNCFGSTSCDSSTPVAKCSGCDWQFGTTSCKDGCPSQPTCSKIDGNVCPQLGSNIEYNWAISDSGICMRDSSKNPFVTCTYDSTSFDYSDVVTYIDKFCNGDCSDNNNFNQILMPNFCFKDTTVCPTIPDTDTEWGVCPHILSNIDGSISGNSGAECINWSNKNKSLAAKSMINYCASSNSGVCNCINREKSAVFKYITNNIPGTKSNPNIWFKSCSNPQSYLVPPTLNSNDSNVAVCAQINNTISKVPTTLSKKALQAELNCNITSTPVAPSTSSSNSSSSNSNSGTSSSSGSWFWILVIGIIIIIILIFLFFLAIAS